MATKDRQHPISQPQDEPQGTPPDQPSEEEGPADEVHVGMAVATPEGDLGAQDVSHSTVTEVTRAEDGHVTSFDVEKGLMFRKHIEVPAERVLSIEQEHEPSSEGVTSPSEVDVATETVVVATAIGELDALTAVRPQTLPATLPADAPEDSSADL